MVVYCGIPTTQQSFLKVARTAGAPLLVSANAFWKGDRFSGYEVLWDIEVPLALDCGGFVAMKRYGGYRWSVLDYIALAVMLRPVWWAAQDYSCEPETAANSAEIGRRIRNTVFTLAETLARVIHWNQELPGLPATAPMPVIQGWKPADYTTCAKLMEDHVISDPAAARILGSNQWPTLVGVGSVCRRNLTGPNNLYQIIDALDAVSSTRRAASFWRKVYGCREAQRPGPNCQR